ncbi:MAG: hypothetical protein NTV52_05195 [Acidobacteria bacterium]|nr:hypothetical protein [Acidobacteriota bacterium]
MDFLLKILYYGSGGVSALLITFFFLAGLYDNNPAETWVHKAVFLTSGTTAFGLLLWSLRVGHFQASWLPGILLAVSALVVFALMTFGGLLMFTHVRWN